MEIKIDSVPYRWEKVSFAQYLELSKHSRDNDVIRTISILLNVPYDTVKKAKITNLEYVIRRLSFVNVLPQWIDTPTEINGIAIPKDVTWESTEQFEEMRKAIVFKDDDAILESYAKIVAIYYQPVATNSEFDFRKAFDMIDEIKKFSCVEVVSVGHFFATKVLASLQNIPQTFLSLGTLTRKRKLDLKGLMKRLSFTLRSIFSRVAISSSKTQ